MEIDVTPETNREKLDYSCSNGEQQQPTTENVTTNEKEFNKNSTHSKKVIKHALRQQAKRRKKNTTIASGNTAVPRIIVKPLPPQPPPQQLEEIITIPVPSLKTPTMKEVLASIPGFSMKPRKRSNKKLSTAAQLEQTKEGCIDIETPDSILVNTNLRPLLNKHTYGTLPPLYQHKLVQLLPTVDRQILSNSSDSVRLNASSLNNEFFARACLEWQERLAEGEFTPENQQKLKSEADKERSKLDPWKLKHFEPIWGDRTQGDIDNSARNVQSNSRPPIKTTIKLRNSTIVNKQKPAAPIKRIRTVGAVTRSCTNYKEESLPSETHTKAPVPDLLPIKSHKTHKPELVITPVQSKEPPDTNPANEVDPLLINENVPSVPEITIINISDSIINRNKETIISCNSRDNQSVNKTTEKRRRSVSSETDLNSPKRRSLNTDLEVPTPQNDDVGSFEETKTSVEDENKMETDDTHQEIDDVRLPSPTTVTESQDQLPETNEERTDCSSPTTGKLSETNDRNDRFDELSSETNERHSESNDRFSETNVASSETSERLSETNDERPSETNLYESYSERLSETMSERDAETEIHESFADELLPTQETIVYHHDVAHHSSSEPDEANGNIETISNESTQQETPPAAPDREDLPKLHFKIRDDEHEEFVGVLTAEEEEDAETEHDDAFRILPNSLILQQDPIVLDKVATEDVIDECAEKLEASVEESDLVLRQLESNFNRVRNITDIDDANEDDRFIDAENYVLESGQISLSTSQKGEKDDDIQATLFAVSREDCCWDVVDSSTEKLLEVPIHALDAVPVGLVGTENATEHVEVIPMQEELEVRLEEGTFPVPNDWPYTVKIDSDIVANALGNADNEGDLPENSGQTQQYAEFSGNQVKLELEVTLTPEIISSDSLVTSTVRSNNSTVTPAVSAALTTVIPPTTIVCFSKATESTPMNQTVNLVTQNAAMPRHGMVQSSSALPYLALSTSQPIRAVPTHSNKNKTKSLSNNNRNRSNNKPPPGAVNLERSYQICQAVIQNSPNRDQLRCQLKPPPSLLAAAAANSAKKMVDNNRTQYGNVTSSRSGGKTFTPPLAATGNYQMVQGGNGIKVKARTVQYQQRQPSPPVVVRHVFTSGQGIPVTMAVLPPQAQALSPEVVEGQNVGQYILVQRAGIGEQPHSVPRSSSAPPSQQQVGTINTGRASQLVSVGARGRPASVDVEHPTVQGPSNDFVVQCPNPGTQAVTRRQRFQHGVVYGDVSVDNQLQNYTVVGGDNAVMVDHPGAAMQSQMVLQQQKSRPSGGESSCPCRL